MSKNIENCIQSAFDKVEDCYNKDFDLLEEFIQERILDNILTEFDDAEESVIIKACQETYRACDVLIRAYVNTAILEVIPQLKKEIISDLKNL